MKFSGINSVNVNTSRNKNLQNMMKHIPFNKTAYNAPVINLASNIDRQTITDNRITNSELLRLSPTARSKIPLNIYQTWYTKDLLPKMKLAVNYIKINNPEFNYELFDDNDCREFIKNNFEQNILNAYDSLIPGAYKADLWRYCILYKKGGIYLDIKYVPVFNFKLINLIDKEHWILDCDKKGIYNALLVCLPGNQILWRAINEIAYNVKTKFYGNDTLSPTGPNLLSKYFTDVEKSQFVMYHNYVDTIDNRYITMYNKIIFISYKGYLSEYALSQELKTDNKESHYGILWDTKRIYKN